MVGHTVCVWALWISHAEPVNPDHTHRQTHTCVHWMIIPTAYRDIMQGEWLVSAARAKTHRSFTGSYWSNKCNESVVLVLLWEPAERDHICLPLTHTQRSHTQPRPPPCLTQYTLTNRHARADALTLPHTNANHMHTFTFTFLNRGRGRLSGRKGSLSHAFGFSAWSTKAASVVCINTYMRACTQCYEMHLRKSQSHATF